MGRRAVAYLVGCLAVILLGVAGTVINLPYAALVPGPTVNTLASTEGQPLIQVEGHRTYATDGHLNLVTFYVDGGPGSHMNLFNVLGELLNPNDSVVSQGVLFQAGLTTAQPEQQDKVQAAESLQEATAAALNRLKIPFRELVIIRQTEPGLPAARVLRAGDVLISVDGIRVTTIESAGKLIGDHSPGRPIVVTVDRRGVIRTFRFSTASNGNAGAVIGVNLTVSFRFPFTVRMHTSFCGDGGCGLMLALGLIDELAPLNLTGGRFIAGAGTVDDTGDVGSVFGIKVLLASLRGQGATIFLTPAPDCKEALRAAPAGLRLVKVSTLNGAVQALEALRVRRPVPTCAR